MNRLKRCIAVLVLTSLCASNVQAVRLVYSVKDLFTGAETFVNTALAISAVGFIGGTCLIGSAAYSAFLNKAIDSTVAAKYVSGAIVTLGAAHLFKIVVAPPFADGR